MYCDFPDLMRCCFCLPLRTGVVALGYLNLLFSGCMVAFQSYILHSDVSDVSLIVITTPQAILPLKISIGLYCLDVIFSSMLIYGAHTKSTMYIKVYYYFLILTIVATRMVQIVDLSLTGFSGWFFEELVISMCGFCIQLYLIIPIRSLLKKLERSGPLVYENPLQQFVSGETRIQPNGVYNNTVDPDIFRI